MKTLTAILIMVSLCGAALFAQDADLITENKGVFSTIANGFAESTRAIHEINQENIAAVKAESKANFETATAPNSSLVKLNETKGFWNKVKVIFENFMDNANANAENERARRAEIQSHSSYRTIIENHRAE